MRKNVDQVADFIGRHRRFVIAGHKEPDGDCVGSQIALGSFLERRGKNVSLVSAGPFKRPEVQCYESRFSLLPPQDWTQDGAACLLLDCSDISRAGETAEALASFPIAVIDHHAAGDHAGEALLVDPKAPATTLLVLELMEAMGGSPDPGEAELLLFGLCTDTGFFRHLGEKSSRTFNAAARLVDAGASPKRVFDAMQGGKSLESRLLLGDILKRVESHFDGRLIYSYETLDDTTRFGLEGRDSDALYQLIQGIKGCEAIAIVRQESEDACTVGFRSRDKVNVAAIAASLGGGGHINAAGLHIKGRIDDVKPKIIDSFRKAFADIDAETRSGALHET
jgi:bifunctional oligoribonuclease and PAP phosphatase NrnA